MFYGHTHLDEISLFFSDEDDYEEPINIAYLAPSLTPVDAVNPGYRIYTIDGTIF